MIFCTYTALINTTSMYNRRGKKFNLTHIEKQFSPFSIFIYFLLFLFRNMLRLPCKQYMTLRQKILVLCAYRRHFVLWKYHWTLNGMRVHDKKLTWRLSFFKMLELIDMEVGHKIYVPCYIQRKEEIFSFFLSCQNDGKQQKKKRKKIFT